jgi:hypothetical protein
MELALSEMSLCNSEYLIHKYIRFVNETAVDSAAQQ